MFQRIIVSHPLRYTKRFRWTIPKPATNTHDGNEHKTYNVIDGPSPRTNLKWEIPDVVSRPPYAVSDKENNSEIRFSLKNVRSGLFSRRNANPAKNDVVINKVRKACRVGRRVLNHVKLATQPGVTTEEIDYITHHFICAHNAYPSPLSYKTFPRSVCTSINNVVVHGIPDSRKLMDGDIINIDVALYLDGVHGDLSETFIVGEVDRVGLHLVDVTKECLYRAIEVCSPGERLSSIGREINSYADTNGFSVCPNFVGHGIGEELHEDPQVFHHKNIALGTMLPGMIFTIEPVLCEGKNEIMHWADGWTVVTADRKRTAQFEHTVLIREDGVEVLTENHMDDDFLQPNDDSAKRIFELLNTSRQVIHGGKSVNLS